MLRPSPTRPDRLPHPGRAAGLALLLALAPACGGPAVSDAPAEVVPDPPLELRVVEQTVAVVGVNYQASFEAVGGSGEGYAWRIAAGELPLGLELLTGPGVQARLFGVPEEVGFDNVTVEVRDSGGQVALETLVLNVIGAEPPDPGTVGTRWEPLGVADAPSPRASHTAVWTGTEMIVWGGFAYGGVFHTTGAAYHPGLDAWRPIASAPAARYDHDAVWTGTEMIVWGGRSAFNSLAEGGAAYNPLTDTWRELSKVNAPAPRTDASVVWISGRMVVWGGIVAEPPEWTGAPGDVEHELDGIPVSQGPSQVRGGPGAPAPEPAVTDGGVYNPFTDSWGPLTTSDGPVLTFHTALSTGSEMLAWGGFDLTQGKFSTAGNLYVPSGDLWLPLPTQGAPSVRTAHTAVWSSARQEMLVWGGFEPDAPHVGLRSGARYPLLGLGWEPISTQDAPAAAGNHTAVWTGTEMIVFGGSSSASGCCATSAGGAYRPSSDTWRDLPSVGRPEARIGHTAVWTGDRMIVFGGRSLSDVGTPETFGSGALLYP